VFIHDCRDVSRKHIHPNAFLLLDKVSDTLLIAMILYGLLLVERYSFFEKVLVFFVTLMCIVFLVSMVMVIPGPSKFAMGLIPRLPKVQCSFVLVPAMVGTTMAAATFVVRPLLMKAKGWTVEHRTSQTRDSCTA
jgi:manganese transport protein